MINKQKTKGEDDILIHHQTMLGQTSAAGMVLNDIDDTEAIFFVFPDLSIRIQGTYTLSCQLVNLLEYLFGHFY